MNPRLTQFVREVERAVAQDRSEAAVLEAVVLAMADLVAVDDWLPPECAQPHPTYYTQYLLHRDPASRFSVVSFVWGPGQATPIHDHLAWGVIGVLRGAELSQAYVRAEGGGMVPAGAEERLERGHVAVVSPRVGDVHRVRNAHGDRVSISIHAYGTDIGTQKRHVFDAQTGAMKEFVSGYSNVAAAG